MKPNPNKLHRFLRAFGEVLAASRECQEVLRTQVKNFQLALDELEGFAEELEAILAEMERKA